MEIKKFWKGIRRDILKILLFGVCILVLFCGITISLISQIRIYAKWAGMSTAMLNYQNEKFHLYNHKAFELPDDMKDLIRIENWDTNSFFDFGAEAYMKEYNCHMKFLLSHRSRFKEEPDTLFEAQDN